MDRVTVDLRACVRCAACSILAPAVFELSKKGTRILRQPETPAEQIACRTASLVCPTQAIAAGPA